MSLVLSLSLSLSECNWSPDDLQKGLLRKAGLEERDAKPVTRIRIGNCHADGFCSN